MDAGTIGEGVEAGRVEARSADRVQRRANYFSSRLDRLGIAHTVLHAVTGSVYVEVMTPAGSRVVRFADHPQTPASVERFGLVAMSLDPTSSHDVTDAIHLARTGEVRAPLPRAVGGADLGVAGVTTKGGPQMTQMGADEGR